MSSFCFVFHRCSNYASDVWALRLGKGPQTWDVGHPKSDISVWLVREGFSTYLPSTGGPHKSIRNWQNRRRKKLEWNHFASLFVSLFSIFFFLFYISFFLYVCLPIARLTRALDQRGARSPEFPRFPGSPDPPNPLELSAIFYTPDTRTYSRGSALLASCLMARAMLYQTIQFI